MGKNWKIEIRTDCKNCGGPLPNARFRTYCCKKCRIKALNKKAYLLRKNKFKIITHTNPNCEDSRRCKPHGSIGPVNYYR